jgi:hypothetical protein
LTNLYTPIAATVASRASSPSSQNNGGNGSDYCQTNYCYTAPPFIGPVASPIAPWLSYGLDLSSPYLRTAPPPTAAAQPPATVQVTSRPLPGDDPTTTTANGCLGVGPSFCISFSWDTHGGWTINPSLGIGAGGKVGLTSGSGTVDRSRLIATGGACLAVCASESVDRRGPQNPQIGAGVGVGAFGTFSLGFGNDKDPNAVPGRTYLSIPEFTPHR